jgi:hypothetical protein
MGRLPLFYRCVKSAVYNGNRYIQGAKRNDALLTKNRRKKVFGSFNSKRERKEKRNCKTYIKVIHIQGTIMKGVFARKKCQYGEYIGGFGSLIYEYNSLRKQTSPLQLYRPDYAFSNGKVTVEGGFTGTVFQDNKT